MSNHTKFVKQSDGKKWNTGTADFANRFKMADMMADDALLELDAVIKYKESKPRDMYDKESEEYTSKIEKMKDRQRKDLEELDRMQFEDDSDNSPKADLKKK